METPRTTTMTTTTTTATALGHHKTLSRVRLPTSTSRSASPTRTSSSAASSSPAPMPPRREKHLSTAVRVYEHLVLLAFWAAFVVLMRAVLGFGSADGRAMALVRDSTAGPPLLRPHVSNATIWAQVGVQKYVVEGPGQRDTRDGDLSLSTRMKKMKKTIPPSSSRPSSSTPSHARPGAALAAAQTTPIRSENPGQVKAWEFDETPDERPAAVPFFEPNEYDEQGRPFAMRIHLEGERVPEVRDTPGRRGRKRRLQGH